MQFPRGFLWAIFAGLREDKQYCLKGQRFRQNSRQNHGQGGEDPIAKAGATTAVLPERRSAGRLFLRHPRRIAKEIPAQLLPVVAAEGLIYLVNAT